MTVLASYSDLVSELGDWLNRADLAAKIPTFIRLFEAKMNRRLRSPDMERSYSFNTVAGTASYALNQNVRELRSIYISADPNLQIVGMSPASLTATYPSGTQGTPLAYSIIGENITFAPTPGSSIEIAYTGYSTLTGLDSGNATNWLLDDHPDAYLAGTLAAAYAFERDDEQAAKYDAILEGVIDEIKKEANAKRLPAGPLQIQPAVRE